MNIFIFAFITALIIFFTNYFLKNLSFFHNYNGQSHQKFLGNKEIPLTGGIYLLIISLLIFYKFSLLICLFLIIIFSIGLASDTNYLSSPTIRSLLQIFFIFIFVYIFKVEVTPTRIYYLDIILNNMFFSFIFTTFCLMIVINGTNFIDGLNSLVLIYYLAIYLIISYFGFHFEFGIDKEKLIYFIIFLIVLSLFNLYNQFFLGDSGAYLLAFVTSAILINIYNFNQNISPFFIILLLWYPCFENLFSIFRKFIYKSSPLNPDSKHLHQYLYACVKKKFKFSDLVSNNISSLIINAFNFIIFFFSASSPEHTKHQLLLLFISIVIYLFVYNLLVLGVGRCLTPRRSV